MSNRYTQPQAGPFDIDRSNVLGRLVAYTCPLGRSLWDPIKKKLATNNGTTLVAVPGGEARNFVPGSSQYITLPSTDIVSGYPLTVAGWCDVQSTDSAGYVLYSLCGSTYKAILGCGATAAGKWLVNQSSTPNPGNGCVANTGRQRFLCIHRNGSFDLYINGVLQSQTSVAVYWGEPAAGNHAIGQRLNGSSPRYWSGSVKDFVVYNRELSASEIAEHFKNPYQIYKNWRALDGIAGGDVTLGLTGQGYSFSQGSIAGSVTVGLTGQVNAFSQGVVAASTGADATVGLTGQGNAFSLGAVTGSVTVGLTGQVNAFSQGVVKAISITSPADRGTLDLPNCSVVANGLTPTINIKNRWLSGDNSSGARFTFFKVTGVNGMTPVFDVDRTNFETYPVTCHFKWSYTGLLGSWNDFTTTSTITGPDVFRSSNSAAFAQDTVYVALNYPWPIGYTRPWIDTLIPSGFVSMPPSSAGNDYVFGTRTATTDGATSGVGNVIPAQPMYSFRVSSAGSNAPDGNPKQHVILFAGMHAAEDVGSYNFKGAVEFLISGNAKAVVLRDWFIFDCYPHGAPSGRAGGGTRNDFEDLAKTQDVNRAWNLTNLETISKHKTAIQSDAGSTIAAIFDFHGIHFGGVNTQYIWDDTGFSGYVSKWLAKIGVYQPSISTTHATVAAGYTGTTIWWGATAKGAHYNLNPEGQYWVDYTTSAAESFGADFMRALSDLASDGEFAYTMLSGQTYTISQGTLGVSTSKALTGQTYAISQGTLGVSTSATVALTGQPLTHSQGSLASGTNKNLTGQTYALAQGTLGVSTSKALTGQTYALAQGTLGVSVGNNVTVALTGQSLSYSQGSLTPGVALTAPGQTYSLTQGSLAVVVGNNATVALTGQSYALTQGLVGKAATVGLTGQYVSFTQGTLGVTTDTNYYVSLAGQNYALTQGTLGVINDTNYIVPLTGQNYTYSQRAPSVMGAIIPRSGIRLYTVPPEDRRYTVSTY